MSNVARKFSHTGPSQGALPLADRGRRICKGCPSSVTVGMMEASCFLL